MGRLQVPFFLPMVGRLSAQESDQKTELPQSRPTSSLKQSPLYVCLPS